MSDEKRCPECGGQMTAGHVIDYRRSSVQPSEWIEGPVATNWIGKVTSDERYEVTAHRCDTCGYLKCYAEKPATAPRNVYS